MDFSIIITAHLDRGFLQECIDSCKVAIEVCKQTMTEDEFEIILASDGNESLRRFVTDNNIKFNLSLPAKNLAQSFNSAVLNSATGDYIRIIADDDLMDSAGFYELCKYAKMYEPDLLIANYSAFRTDKNKPERVYKTDVITDNYDWREIVLKRRIGCGTTLIKRDSFMRVGGMDSDFSISEGYALWLKFLNAGFNKFHFIDVVSLHYRLHDRQKSQHTSGREKINNQINKKHNILTKIKQCKVGSSVQFFKQRFLEKWNLAEYTNTDQPAVFLGMYPGEDRWALREHKSMAIVVWAGSDSMDVKNIGEFNKPNIIHIACNKYISDDLINAGITDFKFMPITVLNQEKLRIVPVPLGDKIYVYPKDIKPNRQYKDFYGSETVNNLFNVFGEGRFILANPTSYTHDKLYKEIYPKCFIGLRFVPHDGLSETVIEMGLFGRRVIYNGVEPNVIPYNNLEDIINIIKSEEKNIGKIHVELAESVRNYINIGYNWLYI